MSLSSIYEKPLNFLRQYIAENGRTVLEKLGNGADGLVYATTERTAIKGFRFRENYCRERAAYQRIAERGLVRAGPFQIPQLVNFDDRLEVIEMTIVSPPFLLDFSAAYIDERPPFSDEQWEAWHEEKEEQFGRTRWSVVDESLSVLKGHGIFLSDIHPGNARFGDETD